MRVLIGVLLCFSAFAQKPVRALVGGTLIDGYGGPPLRHSVILIEGERIKQIGQVGQLAVPAGAEVVSTAGMTVLPGLWDMHVHLMINGHADYDHWDKTYPPQMESVIMPSSAKQLLLAGITSARDLGGPLEASIHVRDAINAGRLPGPTLYVSGPFIQHAPYSPYEARFRWGVTGADDARAKVKQLAQAGVDVIKLIDQDQMTEPEVAAVVEAAHAGGLPVVAHAHREAEIRLGLKYGVDCFEHTGLGTEPGYPEDILEGLRRRNATLYWTPTIAPLFLYQYTADSFPERLDDSAWQEGLAPDVVQDIRRSLAGYVALPYFLLTRRRIPTLAHKFEQLRSTGATMLIGTDAGTPGNFHSDATWHELATWVRLGVSPMEAIQAATRWPARFLKREQDLGTIAPGRYADIIAVRGDVLHNIELLQHVDIVIKGGARVK